MGEGHSFYSCCTGNFKEIYIIFFFAWSDVLFSLMLNCSEIFMPHCTYNLCQKATERPIVNTKASLDVSTKQDVISKAGLNLKLPALPLKIKAQGSAHHRGGDTTGKVGSSVMRKRNGLKSSISHSALKGQKWGSQTSFLDGRSVKRCPIQRSLNKDPSSSGSTY